MNKAKVVANSCKGCGFCIKFCPKNIIAMGTARNAKGHFYPTIVEDECIGCGTCALVCPEAAIEIW